MPKSIAEARTKLVLLSTKPADPEKPTVSELTAGVDLSCNVLTSNYNFGPTDSDKITGEKALCEEGNSSALGASNYQADITLFRYYDEDGKVDASEDAGFQALKDKGTLGWLYERQSGKKSSEEFAADDEVFGEEVLTDHPQKPSDEGGYIKRRVPMEPQAGWFGTVATGS